MPQNAAANNYATTLSAALFGSATLGAALTEGTAVTSLTTAAATDGPIAASDTLTLAEASAITLAVGTAISTTLATALTEGTAYTSLTAAAAATLPQFVTVALQDVASSALTTALTEGTATTSLACEATAGALGVGAILMLSDSLGATLSTALTSGTAYTSITVGAASAANTLASGATIVLISGSDKQVLTTTAPATLSTTADTTISVSSFTANFSYPSGAIVTVQQNAVVSTAAAAAATSITIYSMTPVWSFNTSTVVDVQQSWTTSGAVSGTAIPVNSATALYAFSTVATLVATPPTTATVQGATYTSFLVGALSGALGSGATLTLPNGESTTTSAAAASAAVVVAVNAVQAKGSYASGADVTVSQVVTAAATAAGATSIALASTTTPLWSYTTASTLTAATSAISLTSTTGAPSSYPYLLSLTKAGDTYPNPANPFEVVQVTASGICSRGYEGTIAAWASGDGAGCDFTAGEAGSLTQSSYPPDFGRVLTFGLGWQGHVNTSASGSGSAGVAGTSMTYSSGTTPGSQGSMSLGGQFDPMLDYSFAKGCIIACMFQIPILPANDGDYVTLAYGSNNYAPGTPTSGMSGAELAIGVLDGKLVTQLIMNTNPVFSPVTSLVSIADREWHSFTMWCSTSGVKVWIDKMLAISTSYEPQNAGVPSFVTPFSCLAGNGPASSTNVTLNVYALHLGQAT